MLDSILGTIALASVPVLVFLITTLFKKYVVPMIRTKEQKDLAEHIGRMADEVTDWLCELYPGNKWLEQTDLAVDKLQKIIWDKKIPESHISSQIANRAITAAISRKKVNGMIKK